MDCEGDKEDQKKVMSSRLEKFDAHVNSIARNSEDLNQLQAAGYSPTLWTKVSNMRKAVIALSCTVCLSGYKSKMFVVIFYVIFLSETDNISGY